MRLRKTILIPIILAIAYLLLAFFAPSDPAVLAKYDISETKLRLLNLTVVLPVLAIWFVAFYGFIRFKNYAQLVSDSKEGPALNQLATGLMVLAFSLPTASVISSFFKYITYENPNLIPTAEIIKNYIGLIFALLAFYLISQSAVKLTQAFKIKPEIMKRNHDLGALALIVFSCLFTWLILYRPAIGGAKENVYFLPNWLILLTLAIPYLYAWRAGVLATSYLYRYHNNLKGEVYRIAFKDLAVGIGIVVFVSVLIQSITTISEQLNRLNLTPILILVYVLLVLYAVGFGFIARGAKKLKKIEEV